MTKRTRVLVVIAVAIALFSATPATQVDAEGPVDLPPAPPIAKPVHPRLDSQLNRMVGQVGLASPDDIVLQPPMHQGSSVAVTVHLSGGADAIAAFIEKGGGIAANIGVDYVEAYVPVTILVEAIVPPQPTVVSQGAAVHGAPPWIAPTDGGSAITQYSVTPTSGDLTAVVDGSTLSATVTGLTNGTAYTFIAAASNAIGAGDPSTSSNSVTPNTVPLSPTGVTATAGNGDAMVGWAIPASDGGSPITQYTVTSDLDGLTAAAGGSAASTTVTGLANGTAYTFTMTANPGGQIATPASSTLSVVVTGLDNGTTYTFIVTATNAVGTSATSAASNAVTPPNDPPAVQARADATGKEGALLGLEIATFTDNDPVDTHTASVDWGDGTVEAASVTESGGARTVFASHTYKDNGSYVVTVTAADTFG